MLAKESKLLAVALSIRMILVKMLFTCNLACFISLTSERYDNFVARFAYDKIDNNADLRRTTLATIGLLKGNGVITLSFKYTLAKLDEYVKLDDLVWSLFGWCYFSD